MGKPLSIAMVTSEIDELDKTGGLGDYSGSLARTLKGLGHDVRVFVPLRSRFAGRSDGKNFSVPVDGNEVHVSGYSLRGPVPVYAALVNDSTFYASSTLNETTYSSYGSYGGDEGFVDPSIAADAVKFSKTALMSMVYLAEMEGFRPDVIHCSDWPSAIVSMLAKIRFGSQFGTGRKTGIVYTNHNDLHAGRFRLDREGAQERAVAWLKLNGLDDQIRQMQELHTKDEYAIFCLGKAAQYADVQNTVSPTYGKNLGIEGILNGLDEVNWNPASVLGISQGVLRYPAQVAEAKKRKKKELQKKYGLEQNPDAILISYLHRFCMQKGTEEMNKIVPFLVANPDVQFVACGTGPVRFSPKGPLPKERCYINNSFAQAEEEANIYAASDMFVMPSRFEPCGYSQMKAMSVGAVPVVSMTGGLMDTVKFYPDPSSTGFGFDLESAAYDYLINEVRVFSTVMQALEVKKNRPSEWQGIVSRGMSMDFGWCQGEEKGPVYKYLELYDKAIAKANEK